MEMLTIDARDSAFPADTPRSPHIGCGLQSERLVHAKLGGCLYSDFTEPVSITGFGDLNNPETFARAQARAAEMWNTACTEYARARRAKRARIGEGGSVFYKPVAVVFANYGIGLIASRSDEDRVVVNF